MRILFFALLLVGLGACKHPLEIRGQGSIVERVYGERGCSWEEFQAGSQRCTHNEVKDQRYRSWCSTASLNNLPFETCTLQLLGLFNTS